MPSERSDEELLRAVQDGEPELFGDLYRRRRGVVLAFCIRRVRRADLAADLMAETFAAALLAAHQGRTPPGPDATPWLLTIARNKMIDSYRRGRVEDAARAQLGTRPLALDDDSLERVEELAAASQPVLAALEQLPEQQRSAVRARVLDEREYGDIAKELGCSELVVRKRVSRGLRSMRTTLREAQ